MTQLIKEINNCTDEALDKIRIKYIDLIFCLKKTNLCLSRQCFFLTIAIFEKYILKSKSNNVFNQLTKNMNLKIIVLYTIAQKFIKKNHYKLDEIREIFKFEFSKIMYIQTQYQILQTIQYQIPEDFTYAALTRSYALYKAKETYQLSKELVIKCVGFLEQAVKLSRDFSLCPQLGGDIITSYRSNSIKDIRIKKVLDFCKLKRSNKLIVTEALK